VHLLNPRPTHPPSGFNFLGFLLVHFWVFLGKGSSKTPQQYFGKQIDKNFDVSFSSFFCFIAFSGFLKNAINKKNRTKKSDPCPFLASDPLTHQGGHRFCFGGPLLWDFPFPSRFAVYTSHALSFWHISWPLAGN
jgi:hypothetical protein